MKKALRIAAVFLLVFNAVPALYGGIAMMLQPSGELLGMSVTQLQHSPFRSYFIPGLVLFLVNGISSCIVAFLVITRRRNYPFFIVMQGTILTGWIIIQVMLLQFVYFLHYVMGINGLLLLAAGFVLRKRQKMQ